MSWISLIVHELRPVVPSLLLHDILGVEACSGANFMHLFLLWIVKYEVEIDVVALLHFHRILDQLLVLLVLGFTHALVLAAWLLILRLRHLL